MCGGFLAPLPVGSDDGALCPAGITLELLQTLQPANLARREANLALRHQPAQERRLLRRQARHLRRRPLPAPRRGRGRRGWPTPRSSRTASTIPRAGYSDRSTETKSAVALRAPSLLMHAEAIRAGTGRGVLPCYVGDTHPVLERLTAPIPELAATYWMVRPPRSAPRPCVRAAIDWVRQAFAEQRDGDRRRRLEDAPAMRCGGALLYSDRGRPARLMNRRAGRDARGRTWSVCPALVAVLDHAAPRSANKRRGVAVQINPLESAHRRRGAGHRPHAAGRRIRSCRDESRLRRGAACW